MDDDNIIPFAKPKSAAPEPSPPRKHPPMINLPPYTKIGLAVLLAIHLLIYVISMTVFEPMEYLAINFAGFTPANFTGGLPFGWWVPFQLITYAFLHAGWLHIIVNIVMLAASASGIERLWDGKRMLIIFFGSSVIAALTHFAFYPHSTMPIVGASGGISGLFGALIYLMQQTNRGQGLWKIVLIWLGVSVITGMIGAPNGMPIAWLAHVGGFIGGLGMAMQMAKQKKSP